MLASLPPGPRGNWLLGTWPDWRRDLLGQMERLVGEYGDAVRYHFVAGFHGYLFSHPDHLKHILQDNYKNYRKGHPTYLVMKPFVGRGILTNDGQPWLRQRRLMQPAFHHKRIAQLGTVMTGAAEAMLARWEAATQRDGIVQVDREMTRLTLEVVGKALFGHDLQSAAVDALPAFSALGHDVTRLSVTPLGVLSLRFPFLRVTRRMRANIARLDAIVGGMVARRQASGESGDDLLGMLLEARDEETGEGMDAQQLRDEIMTLMFAGHETTAQALTWAFFLISKHPKVEARLRDELANRVAGATPTVEDLPALEYTRRVVQEVLRIRPPVYAFPRQSDKADEVGGYRVEANAMITLSPYLTHRHPEFWGDPERFDPERFTPDQVAARHRYAYIPFSGGPRQCIGNNFALMEIQLVLATVLQRYRLEPIPGHPVTPSPMIALRPEHGLPMRLTRANRPAAKVALC